MKRVPKLLQMRRLGSFLENHPFLCFLLWCFVAYPLLAGITARILDTSDCTSFRAGRRQNLFVTCDWNVHPFFGFILDMTIGAGPILGPAFFILFIVAPAFGIIIGLCKKFAKSEIAVEREISPYGSLEKHRHILLSSGAAEEDVDKILERFRDP